MRHMLRDCRCRDYHADDDIYAVMAGALRARRQEDERCCWRARCYDAARVMKSVASSITSRLLRYVTPLTAMPYAYDVIISRCRAFAYIFIRVDFSRVPRRHRRHVSFMLPCHVCCLMMFVGLLPSRLRASAFYYVILMPAAT